MSATDNTPLYDRIAKKKQKNLMLSRELIGVLSMATERGKESQFVEGAVWTALVDEHGEEEIREMVDDVQAEIDDRDKLANAKAYTLTE